MDEIREQPDPNQTAALLKQRALDLGFDLVGIAPAEPSRHADYVRQWIASGQAAGMDWMTKHVDALCDVRKLLPSARSVLCVAANYYFPIDRPANDASRGLIARYALGNDYHEVFKDRLHDLADHIRSTYRGAQTKCGVDISPILEREFAAAAGVGWVGKNTCIIHPRIGSWVFLGEVITSLDLQLDVPESDHCGACTRCIDACPTGAITGPYHLDARRCISYLNIERREPLDAQQKKSLGQWLVGCDICQDVCPFNRKAPEGTLAELRPRFPDGAVDLNEVIQWDEPRYRQEFKRSAVRRVKLPVLQANARTLLLNSPSLAGREKFGSLPLEGGGRKA